MLSSSKRNIVAALSIGVLLATGWFLVCFSLSRLPVVSPVSLAIAFQPWWRHWQFGVVLLVLPVLISGAFLLRRPPGT